MAIFFPLLPWPSFSGVSPHVQLPSPALPDAGLRCATEDARGAKQSGHPAAELRFDQPFPIGKLIG